MFLGGFIGMQLQTERSKVDLLKPRLYHRQGRHLLSHKQHPLALIQSVGNHVRDGLRLTGSWRAVQDKTPSPTRLHDSLHLRRVHIQGNGEVHGFTLLVDMPRIHALNVYVLLVLFLYQRGYHYVFLQFFRIRMNIVPHHELVERKQTQHRLFHNAPPIQFYDGLPEIVEYQFHVHSALIFRQFFQSVQINPEVLLQQFHQGDVQDDVLVAFSDDVVVAALADDVHRQEQDGGITRLFAFGIFIPLQHAQCQEKAVGTILLHRGTGRPMHVLQGILQFRFRQVGSYLMVTDQFRHCCLIPRSLLFGVIHAGSIRFQFLAWRRCDVIVLTILKMVFQRLYLKRDKGYHLPAKSGVQEIVA